MQPTATSSLACPLCKPNTLTPVTLEPDLIARQCAQCHGIWLNMNDYVTWVRDHPETSVARGAKRISVTDNTKLKACPADGHALRFYKVGPAIDFTLDRCATCHGVWFDGGEWEALRNMGLLTRIHNIFTEVWQRAIREAAHRRTVETLYTEKLGADLYKDLRRIKAWLNKHPQKSVMLAYLLDDDPYGLHESKPKIIES